MKMNFDIECTPEEARKFLGLPDIVPMQDAIMKQLQQRLSDNIKQLDPETLVKTWMPVTIQNWTDMQRAFWGQMGTGQAQNVNPFGFGMTPPASTTTTKSSSRPASKSRR